MKKIATTLLCLVSAASFSSLQYSTVDGRPVISGSLDGPLTIFGAKGTTIEVTGNFPVTINQSEDIVVRNSSIVTNARPLTIVHSKNVIVQDSIFNANGGDVDAALVTGVDWSYNGNSNYSYYAYRQVWGAGVPWDVTKIEYGAPPERALNPSWVWNTTTSYRTGSKLFHGYNPAAYSQNISFKNCQFLNAKRAGLFVHHAEGTVVEDCVANPGTFKLNEADYSFEWTARTQVKNTQALGNGVFTHYHNLGMVLNNVEALAGVIQFMSHGQPVKQIDVIACKAKGVKIWNGQMYNYSAAGWLEDIKVKNGEYGYVWMASGQVNNGSPEVLAKNIVLEGITVNWNSTLYPVAVRTESINGYSITGTINGQIQDFAVGGRIPSTLIP